MKKQFNIILALLTVTIFFNSHLTLAASQYINGLFSAVASSCNSEQGIKEAKNSALSDCMNSGIEYAICKNAPTVFQQFYEYVNYGGSACHGIQTQIYLQTEGKSCNESSETLKSFKGESYACEYYDSHREAKKSAIISCVKNGYSLSLCKNSQIVTTSNESYVSAGGTGCHGYHTQTMLQIKISKCN